MAARSIASLSLSFGLVSIPVKLYSATENSATVRFNMLAKDGARLKQQYVSEKDGQPVERAVLRLAGLSGADADGMPLVNHLVDAVRAQTGLEHGVALPAWDALVSGGYPDLAALAVAAAAGQVSLRIPAGADADAARTAAGHALAGGFARIDANRAKRQEMIDQTAEPRKPWMYLIVATGDIYEDIPQAQAAAREGADVVAVIRSTGQSLLDYVPEGATREGFAGTYATQENFRLMRAALDDVSRELGRYVRLTNYASGLCMPEIASLAGLERLDMMLNDSMYGIIFRDINPRRTLIDQRFSRQIHARAGIIINTGEDNYLTTADPVDSAHTVIVSQLLNEFFAKEAGLADSQLGLGHAFDTLGLRRVEFKTDALNEQSRAAILGIGAQFEGIFRKHMVMANGRARDSAYYSVIDTEWPDVRAHLQARLARHHPEEGSR